MPLLIDLIIEKDEAREARDAGQITAEECEARCNAAHVDFRRKEQAAWEQQGRAIANFLNNCTPVPDKCQDPAHHAMEVGLLDACPTCGATE